MTENNRNADGRKATIIIFAIGALVLFVLGAILVGQFVRMGS